MTLLVEHEAGALAALLRLAERGPALIVCAARSRDDHLDDAVGGPFDDLRRR